MHRVRSWIISAAVFLSCASACGQGVFLRGDCNRDGTVDVGDAVFELAFLFAGGQAPPCMDAADANDSGDIDISDAIFILSYLFQGQSPPPAPGPSVPGPDPTPDDLDCGGGAPGEVRHPYTGRFPKLLSGVAYDVDESESLDLDETRLRIDDAPALALDNNLEHVDPRLHFYMLEPLSKFHFWPNIFNLTEIRFRDAALFDRILLEILEGEPDQARILDAATRAADAGERLFLARDFVDRVTAGEKTYFEVHYAFLLNLDAKELTEITVHRYASEGLGPLHDPHTDLLISAFGDPDGPLGETWHICLRGNLKRGKYEAMIVDKLAMAPEAEFYVERIHKVCFCEDGSDWREPVIPFFPLKRPPERIFPKKERPLRPLHPRHPVPPPGTGQGPDGYPVTPWPYDDTSVPQPTGEDPVDDPRPGEGGPVVIDCNEEERAAVREAIGNLEEERAEKIRERAADREAFERFTWEWPEGVEFNDPCLRELYAEYAARIAQLKAQLAQLESQYSQRISERDALPEETDPVLNALKYRNSIWENMLTVGGAWSQIRTACMPPWIPAGGNPFEDPTGGSVIIVDVERQAGFQRDIFYGLMNGKTFEQAVADAINNPKNYPPDVVPRDKIWQMIWRQYADCLKKLLSEQLDMYLRERYPGASAEEIAAMKAVLFGGEADLPENLRSRWEDSRRRDREAREAMRALAEQMDEIRRQMDSLRDEFRRRARECFKRSLTAIREAQTLLWILQAFLVYCDDPNAEEGLPWMGENFCKILRAIPSDPRFAALPGLKAYVRMLAEVNC